MSHRVVIRGIAFEVAEDMTGVDGSWSLRPCDECRKLTPFDNPDADVRVCFECASRAVREEARP